MWVISSVGLPHSFRQMMLASFAISTTAGFVISSLCLIVGEPSVASSGYSSKISFDMTVYLVFTVVVLPGECNIKIMQKISNEQFLIKLFENFVFVEFYTPFKCVAKK